MRGTRRAAVGMVGLLAVVLAVACGGGGVAPTSPVATKPAATTPAAKALTGDAGRGATLFTQSCSACHGPDAKGVPNLGKDMTTSAFIKGQTDPQLIEFVKKGRPVSDPANTTKVDMPPKGGNPALTDQQLADIVAHIRTLMR